jgi:hypothetical protein
MSKKSNDPYTVANPELQRLAEEQGVKPLDLDAILSQEPLGPEDETADMMIEEIYRWRREGRDRSLP